MSVADIMRRYAKVSDITQSDAKAHEQLMNGGFSRQIWTGEEPKSGYMVGLHADHGGHEAIHDLGEVHPQHLADHLHATQDAFIDHPQHDHVYQGGWAHDGKAYIDRSVNLQDHDEAMEAGRRHKQLAIWDVSNSRELPVDH